MMTAFRQSCRYEVEFFDAPRLPQLTAKRAPDPVR